MMLKLPLPRGRLLPILLAALIAPQHANANFSCTGTIGYLGVDSGGYLLLALSGSTPIHRICGVSSQSTFGIGVGACKAMYATFLAARLAGKSVTVYYGDDGLTCSTLPSWGDVPSAYFVEGPN